MRGHAAARGEHALRGIHSFDVLGGSFQPHEHDLLARVLTLHRLFRGESYLAASRAGGSGETFRDRLRLFERLGVKLRVQERVELLGLYLQKRLFLADHALVHEVAGDTHRGARRTLAVARLQHEQPALFDGELHVLHVLVLLFERLGDGDELIVNGDIGLSQMIDGLRGADTRDHVFALRVHQIFAVDMVFARGGVTGKGNARARGLAHIAEDHGLNVDRRAPAAGDVVFSAVDDGALVVPAAEDRLDRLDELHLGILGEVLFHRLLIDRLELFDQLLQVFGGEIGVHLYALCLFDLVDYLFEFRLGNAHDHVGEHLNESAIAVVSEAGIARLCRKSLDGDVVETKVENGVHHAGHGRSCARTHGHEEGILFVAELLAHVFFHERQGVEDLLDYLVIQPLAVVVITGAGFGGDGKAGRHGHAPRGHLGEVRALAAEQVLSVAVCFLEQINVLFRHNSSTG